MDATGLRFHRRGFLGLAAAATALPGLARAGAPGVERLEGRAFGTTWAITAPEGSALAELGPGLERLLAEVDRQMSPWRPDSEITAVNRGRAGRHAVSPATAGVCAAALSVAEASGGWFDPTVGPLVARWGFGPIAGEASGDWRDLGTEGAAIAKARDGTTVDLCGIAKGWALDRLAELLVGAGRTAAFIDLGGEVMGLGHHPSGRPWRAAVEDPRQPGAAAAALDLPGLAVATSGLAWQSYAAGGRTYGHIVDPRHAAPAGGALRSVSVAGPDAMRADAWATALFAAGAEDGPALARRLDLAALFLIGRGDRLVPEATGRMAELLL